ILSDTRGGEEDYKMRLYGRIGVPLYVLFDPQELLGHGVLRAFGLHRGRYQPAEPGWFPEVGLGLRLWTGLYAAHQQTWLRWCERDGRVIPTGAERAEEERRRADEAQEKVRRLAAQLRALGVEPEV